jgi:hypothetical protein
LIVLVVMEVLVECWDLLQVQVELLVVVVVPAVLVVQQRTVQEQQPLRFLQE